MLKQELKRGFSRLSFKISFTIVLVISIISALKVNENTNLLETYVKTNILTSYDGFIFFNLNGISNILILIMPLLAALNYSDSYLEDIKSGIIKGIYTRNSKEKYLINKYLANFIISGASFTIPLIINLLILMCRFPTIEPNSILGNQTILGGGLLQNLFYERPLVYMGMWFIIYFSYAGAFASIALSFSLFIKNKFIILSFPFIFSSILSALLEVINKSSFNPMTFLYLSINQSLAIIVGEFVIITILTFTVFYFGGRKSEIY